MTKKKQSRSLFRRIISPGNPFFGVGTITRDIKRIKASQEQESTSDAGNENSGNFQAVCKQYNLDDDAIQDKFVALRRLSHIFFLLTIPVIALWLYTVATGSIWMGYIALSLLIMLLGNYAKFTFFATQIKKKKLISFLSFLKDSRNWWVR